MQGILTSRGSEMRWIHWRDTHLYLLTSWPSVPLVVIMLPTLHTSTSTAARTVEAPSGTGSGTHSAFASAGADICTKAKVTLLSQFWVRREE